MHKATEITRAIHENVLIVVSFAYGLPSIEKVIQKHFKGEWKNLNRTIFETGEKRADRALLELATQLRVLDDAQNLAPRFPASFGNVTQGDGKVTDLFFRDMTNKVIHGAEYSWRLKEKAGPSVNITSGDPTRWQNADVHVLPFMALAGILDF